HGTTVARCIREVRLQEAKRRIEEEADAPIATISAQCGFYDPAHVRRLFREHFDMNPSDVRGMVRTPARQSSRDQLRLLMVSRLTVTPPAPPTPMDTLRGGCCGGGTQYSW